MDFFKSVFSDELDPQGTDTDSQEESEEQTRPEQSNANEDEGGWSFGGLMKTIATRSESVIETYRRDLEEFGTGLKKEIEVAQGSLGTMGHAIDEIGNTVLKGTAEIIAQGKEAILAAGNESDSSDNNSSSSSSLGRRGSFSSKPYSRFDAQVRAVQGDINTYCEENEDSGDYRKWESEFSFDEKAEEMERLFEENGEMKGIYKRVVPSMVVHETFWFRYFYKVHKLKQAEDLRANLVKRAISLDDEEELSWDIDDEEETSEKVHEATEDVSRLKLEGNDDKGSRDVVKDSVMEESTNTKDEVTSADSVIEVSNDGLKANTDSEMKKETGNEEVSESIEVVDASASASDEAPIRYSSKPKAVPESKTVVDAAASASDDAAVQDSGKPEDVPDPDETAPSKDSAKQDVAASSSTQQPSEEDLGWDEIEDMSSIDSKEPSRSGGSPSRTELRKRLSAAEEDEDLSWDIEDDDEESPSSKA